MIPQEKSEIISTLPTEMESQAFSVKVNDKAFDLLFSGLYSDKYQSIVREITCNALDGHTAAGVPKKPFLVTAPTVLNPNFIVRDYGCSLTHDQVMHLYTTVFESTKDQSNDFIGAMGLGSKSPFAYTDSFTATAYMDGTKRIYLASMTSERIPTITFLGEEPTEEPNGFEVSIPSSMTDTYHWERAVRRVSLGFDVPFKTNVSLPKLELKIEGKAEIEETSFDWKMYSYSDVLDSGRFYIKMGSVLYPVDLDVEMGGYHSGGRLVVELPIGTVDVAASREAIQSTKTTKSLLARISSAINSSKTKLVQEKIDEETTWDGAWNASRNYNDIGVYGRDLKWEGKEIREAYSTVIDCEAHSRIYPWTTRSSAAKYVPHPTYWNKVYDMWQTRSATSKHKVRTVIDKEVRTSQRPLILVENSKVVRKNLRIESFANQLKDGKALYTKVYLLKDPSNKDVERVMRFLNSDGSNVFNLRALPDVKPEPRPKKTDSKPLPLYKLIKDRWSCTSLEPVSGLDEDSVVENSFWLPTKTRNAGIEVEFAGRTAIFSPSKFNESDFRTLYDTLRGNEERLGAKSKLPAIVFATKRVQTRLNLDPERRADKMLTKFILDNKDAINAERVRAARSGANAHYYINQHLDQTTRIEDRMGIPGLRNHSHASLLDEIFGEKLALNDEIEASNWQLAADYPMVVLHQEMRNFDLEQDRFLLYNDLLKSYAEATNLGLDVQQLIDDAISKIHS